MGSSGPGNWHNDDAAQASMEVAEHVASLIDTHLFGDAENPPTVEFDEYDIDWAMGYVEVLLALHRHTLALGLQRERVLKWQRQILETFDAEDSGYKSWTERRETIVEAFNDLQEFIELEYRIVDENGDEFTFD